MLNKSEEIHYESKPDFPFLVKIKLQIKESLSKHNDNLSHPIQRVSNALLSYDLKVIEYRFRDIVVY